MNYSNVKNKEITAYYRIKLLKKEKLYKLYITLQYYIQRNNIQHLQQHIEKKINYFLLKICIYHYIDLFVEQVYQNRKFMIFIFFCSSTKSFVKSNDLRLKPYWYCVDIVTFDEICFNRINRATSFYSKRIHNNTKRVRENSYSYKTIYSQKENMYDLINTIRRNDNSKNYSFPF